MHDNNSPQEFKEFMYRCFGKNLKIRTRQLHQWKESFVLPENKVEVAKNILKKYDYNVYRILDNYFLLTLVNKIKEEHEEHLENKEIFKKSFLKNKLLLEYINQYYVDETPNLDIKDIMDNELHDKASCKRILAVSPVRDFDGLIKQKEIEYTIIDLKDVENAKLLFKHILELDIPFNVVKARNENYNIDGLAWFELINIDRGNKKPITRLVDECLWNAHINMCHYYDSNGKIDFFTHMRHSREFSSRQGFRPDLLTYFLSSWEANIARILKFKNHYWEYEKQTFNLKDTIYKNSKIPEKIYIPDFFLDNNVIIEVKGFWDLQSVDKVFFFKQQYPEFKLLIVDGDMYSTLEKMFCNIIPNWEYTNAILKKEIIPVVGITLKERKLFVENLKLNDTVFLQRDPDNQYDKNAIRVLDKNGNMIGHIAKQWACIYAEKIDLGMEFNAIIKDKEPKVLNISISRSNIEENIVYDFLRP